MKITIPDFLTLLTNYSLYIISFLVIVILFLLLIVYFKNRANKRLNQIVLDKLKEADSYYYEYQKALQIIAEYKTSNKKLSQMVFDESKRANSWYDKYQQAFQVITEYKDERKKAIERSKKRKEQEELDLKELEYKKSLGHKLNLIENCKLNAKDKFMGIHEFIIYKELIFCEDIKKNFIVCPQVPLAAFINDNTAYSDEDESKDQAWTTYSNLRADFLFVLKDFKNNTTKPFAILEFNGSGHYGIDNPTKEEVEKVKNRDKIKEEAILKAGLGIYTLCGEAIYEKDNPKRINQEALKVAVDKIAATFKKWQES